MSSQLQVTGEAKIRDIQGPVVANSGVITALDGAASQYVRGDGTLADFPTSSGGGSSVSYYLNSSVSQGTIGGVAYRELSKDPIIGAGTDIAISSNGYVANYITDVNDPDVTIVPGGNFNCEFYFSVSNDTGNPFTYAELYKYDGTTFTLLGSSVGVPEYINQGTIIAPYYFAIPVPTSALALTDRLAIRIYVNVDGRTVTLHTENSHLCQVVTTLSKGMVSLNNLTDQSQFLTTGTAGTNFTIASTGDTHTFNLPVASATNTGKLSSTDWSTFNNKIAGSGTINNIPKFTASGTIGDSSLSDDSGTLRYQGIGFRGLDIKSTNNSTSIRLESYSASTNADNGIKEIEMDGYYSSFNSYFGYNSSGAEWLINGYADTVANTTNRGTTTWQIPSLDGNYGYFDVRSYHSATPIIRAFASNNVVIGGSTNNSFKLEVVGTTKISGVLTLGSTISNGTNTYTLPSATGTLALTSNLSSYVPYTGATASVDLGTNTLTALGVIANSFSAIGNINPSGNGGYIFLKQGIAPFTYDTGYNSITANSTRFVLIANVDASNNKSALLELGSLTNNTQRTFTLPDLSGTLALLEAENVFTNINAFDYGINYKTDGSLANVSGYITQGYAKSGTGAGSTLSLKISDGNSVKAINLDFVGSPATYTYTFPASSGTIALTSNLSSYVPYTGATANVNLGVYDISVSGIKVESNVSGGTAVNIKQNSTTLIAGAGYISIGAKDLDTLLFSYGGATNSDYKAIRLKTTNIPNTSSRVYEFPNADGTLALTSNLSAYLPLAGGTLTGALSGTSATFSGIVSSIASSGSTSFRVINADNSRAWSLIPSTNAAESDLWLYYGGTSAGTKVSFVNNGNVLIGSTTDNGSRLQVTGAATFSSSVTAAQGIFSLSTSGGAIGSVKNIVALNTNESIGNWSGINFSYSNSGTNFGYIGTVLTTDVNNSLADLVFGVKASNTVTAVTEYMRIKGGGNVGIGTNNPIDLLSLSKSTYPQIRLTETSINSTAIFGFDSPSNEWRIRSVQSYPLTFGTNDTERMRLTSGGYFKASNNGNYIAPTGTAHEFRNTNENWVLELINAHGSVPYGLHMYYSNAAPNSSSGSQWLWCEDTVNIKAAIYSNGTFASRTSTYGGFSDIKLKENIKPATSKLNDLLKVNVVNYNFIDDSNKEKQIGVIAQELESIFPNMIFETDDYENIEIEEKDENGNITKKIEKKELGTKTKSVKYSIFIPMLIKAIQEQQAQIEELKQLIAAK